MLSSPPPCGQRPSIYANTAAIVVKLLTLRLGAGRAEVEWDEVEHSEYDKDGDATGVNANGHAGSKHDFAPRGPPKVTNTLRGVVSPPWLKARISRQSPVGRLCSACARAVKAKPSAAENARFIEHFRYTIVASQLLDEHTNQAPWRTNQNALSNNSSPVDFKGISTSGAIATGVTALTLIWLVHWSKGSFRPQTFNKSKAAVVLVALAIVTIAFYLYARRQLLLFLRHQAVQSSGDLVSSLQTFDASASSAISLIQEVELVSRGYRLSTPLPPITRIEQASNTKRCLRLRKSLRTTFAATIPALADACQDMHKIIDEDDLERYLDVYDVNNEDVQDAAGGWKEDESDDVEGLKALRIHLSRFITLRRLFLCSLLAIEADGSGADFAKWRLAGEVMQKLAVNIAESADKISKIMSDEDSFNIASPTTPNSASDQYFPSGLPGQSPARQRLREQFRKLATLSTGIRSLQAKMQILREESQLALSLPNNSPSCTLTFLDGRTDNIDTATDDDMQLAELGNSLLAHYDAIGSDLKSLVQAWESGRTGLSLSLERAERRISRTSGFSSSGLRSPAISLGGLTAVDELLGGSPDDALKALEGDSSAPDRSTSANRGISPGNLRISTSTEDMTDTPDSGLGMDEVYEAVAAPRPPRSLGTPQERAARITEERRRMSVARERRDASNQMIRELEAVIGASGSSPGDARSSSFDRRRPRGFSRGDTYDFAAKRASLSPVPISPMPVSPGALSNASMEKGAIASGTGPQVGVRGRRRPFSMYSIGNRVTSA